MPRSCEAAHEDSKVEAQRGKRFITSLLITDPWSKGDYSPYIREASMAMDGLSEGVSPSGRVPEQLLQAAPILKRRRRRNREVFAKKGFVLGVSTPRGKYRRRGESRGPTRQSGGCPARPRVGPRHQPSWLPGGAPLPFLVIPEGSLTLIFNIIFQNFLSTLNSRKT